jgi:hypothetical protein
VIAHAIGTLMAPFLRRLDLMSESAESRCDRSAMKRSRICSRLRDKVGIWWLIRVHPRGTSGGGLSELTARSAVLAVITGPQQIRLPFSLPARSLHGAC